MRLVDADALKEAMYQNGGCGICSMYVDDAPTIDAIPVVWLREKMKTPIMTCANPFDYVFCEWMNEQEAQDG